MATWRPKLSLYPPRDETEPNRRLEDLVEYLKVQLGGENLADWFIENLASAFKIPIVTGRRGDPVRHLDKLGEAFIAAMRNGGSDRTKRLALRKVAIRVLLEVMALNRQWWEK